MSFFAHTFPRSKSLWGLTALISLSSASAQLKVDFTPTGGDVEPGFAGYFATHEESATFTTQNFGVFGSTVTITPDWPNTTDARVRQMIQRGAGNNANWVGDHIDFLKDFIGVDTRTGNGGLGDFNGTTGTPTYFTLTLTGLPSEEYSWLSYHHDTENVFTSFQIEYSADGGGTFTPVPGTFVGTDSTPNGTPASPQTYTGSPDPNPANLPSTATFNFNAVAGQDVVIRFTPLSMPGVHQQIWVMNAFEVNSSGDTDGDGMPDSYESVNGLDPTIADANDDLDNDGLTNIQEYRGTDGNPGTGDETNPNNPDSDGDGLTDGDELNVHFTNPLNSDSDDDFFSDGDEVAAGSLPNDNASFPVSTAGLFIDFSSNGGNQTGPVHDPDYLPYIATDRTESEVAHTEVYPTAAFGGLNEITFAVTFPNPGGGTLLENALRMIGRGNTAANQFAGLNQRMIRDWIGFDNRTASGGNGDSIESQMLFTFTGLPAGKYLYVSHHHDLGAEQGDFSLSVTDANRDNETIFTKSGTSNNDVTVTAGASPSALPSRSNFVFESSGPATPVVIRYSSVEVARAFEGFVVVNGLEITPTLDSDNDGIPDDVETASGVSNPVIADSNLDPDNDNLTSLQEYYLGTAFNDEDTDDDGLVDGDEVSTHGTNPFNSDSDGDGLPDGQEVNELGSNPLNANSDGDFETVDTDGSGEPNKFSDLWEFLAGSNLNDGANYPDIDDDGYSPSQGDENDNDIAVFPMPSPSQLFVDFNSNQGGGGDSTTAGSPADSAAAHNQLGYFSYHANHEVTEEFTTASYEVFGSSVTLTPSWPDSSLVNTTQQSIDRGDGNDRNWHGDKINLLTDWIGVDTRTGVSGNGAFDGTTGAKTRFHLTLGNLPGATYSWRSYHHDTENVHADFTVAYSTDGGVTFTPVPGPNGNGTFSMTDSTAGGTPASPAIFTGAEQGSINPADLPSTVNFSFTANGSDQVIIEFTPYSTDQVHKALLGVNGFELTGPPGLGNGITITSNKFDESGAFVIDFRGSANTDYELLKSTTLNDDFVSIGMENDTDGSGNGQFIIPAIQLNNSKAFFVVRPVAP